MNLFDSPFNARNSASEGKYLIKIELIYVFC